MLKSITQKNSSHNWAFFWGFTIGVWMLNEFLFQNANPTGDYFNFERYFTIDVFLPGWIFLIALVFIEHFWNRNYLQKIIAAWNIVVIFWFAADALNFAAANPEGPMYIYSYLMIYDRILYSCLLLGCVSQMYLCTLDFVDQLRKQLSLRGSKRIIIQRILLQCGLASLICLTLILIAQYNSIGMAYILIALSLWYCIFDYESIAIK